MSCHEELERLPTSSPIIKIDRSIQIVGIKVEFMFTNWLLL